MATAYLSVRYIDSQNRTTTRRYEMADQVLLADYVAAASGFLTILESDTDLGVERADLVIPEVSAGFAVTAGANVDVGATFTGNLDVGGGKKASLKLPGVKAAKWGTNGNVPIDGTIGSLLALFETDGDFRLSDGEQIDAWVKGTLDK